jgi:hypothetical protein
MFAPILLAPPSGGNSSLNGYSRDFIGGFISNK